MTEAENPRPLVSFVLFAYNQEAFIREAVEGAFAQTYSPLEIILSDDCSKDRTFEIMQEMAAAYKGPHRVRVVRNEPNMGLVPHVLARGREARGAIVVVAAGDDISYPDRVSRHVSEYDDPSVFAVSGGFDVIDDKSAVLSRNHVRPIGQPEGKKATSFLRDPEHDYVVIQGSTASYRREVFSFPLPDIRIRFSEDNLFNFLVYAHQKRVAFVARPLIAYRAHAAALSHHVMDQRSLTEFEMDSRSAAETNINKVEVFSWVASQQGGTQCDLQALKDFRRTAEQILGWPDLSVSGRVMSVLGDIVLLRGQLLKWKLFRVAGRYPAYQPKILLTQILRRRK